MRTLIISDLHNRVSWIDKFLGAQTFNEVVFLGDYFDSWKDNELAAASTARWLKQAIEKYKNAKWILGNHDIPYIFPWNTHITCPGFTIAKNRVINEILGNEWSKFRLCYYTQGFLLSHAGVLSDIFTHPVNGLSIEVIEERCKEALKLAAGAIPTAVLSQGRDRNGLIALPGGGITWCDWNSLENIVGLNQIVGHTVDNFVRCQQVPGSENYCLDTNNRHIGQIIDGKFSYFTRG